MKGIWMMAMVAVIIILSGCENGNGENEPGGNSTGGERNPVCNAGSGSAEVQAPEFVRNLSGQTSWYASPVVADLDGNGSRIYAPHVVVDLEGDGTMEIVCGQGKNVYTYEWKNRQFSVKAGWPVDTTCTGSSPEVRGLAAADLDNNGSIEIIATTTQTLATKGGGSQVYVWSFNGDLYQPAGLAYSAWPRYNNRTGEGGDADRNEMGHSGYGCYGLNVAVGNIDEDAEREIIVTYDNHHIQVFDPDGEAIDASSWFTNRSSAYQGNRMTWGQFIRWCDPDVEKDHYHLNTGDWPHPERTEWLQWTASPPHVADLDLDGENEVIGIPNVEFGVPYDTRAYAVMVLEGDYGDGSRSAMRKAGWEDLPRGDLPIDVDGWYPPGGVPAAAIVDLRGNVDKEIVVSLNDGFMTCFSAAGVMIWRYNYANGKSIMYASEPMVADLNQDGSPEVIFSTYGDPDVSDSGHLVILGADGSLLHDTPLPDPGYNGNGNGAPAAPTIADLDGDGQLEIMVQTFEHGMDIFTVPGSGGNCLLWSTARGGPLRMGQPSGME